MRSRFPLASAMLGSLLAFASSSAGAQPATRAVPQRDSAGMRCSTEARVLAVRVLDRVTGAPIAGASLTATRTRSGARLDGAGPMGPPGDYLIAEDGGVPGLTRAGEPLVVEVRLGDRRVRADYVIGLTADGCHLEVREGPKVLRL